MAEKEKKTETNKIEREYTINLRRKVEGVPIYKRAPKAIRTVKEFLVRHMKIYDRDLDKVRIDRYLNEFLWGRGIRNPQTRIKVKAVKEGDIVKVELAEAVMPNKLKFKKAREERREQKGAEVAKQKKEKKTEEPKQEEQKTEEKKEEESEKKAATVEAGKEMEKAAKKMAKHETKTSKQPKRQPRMALQK